MEISNSHPLSSANEVKHRFCSSSLAVVRLEGLKDIADLKAALVACYKPANYQELLALERMAMTQADRQYRRAREEFDPLKKLRPELPNEPNIGTGPEPPADLIMQLSPELTRWRP